MKIETAYVDVECGITWGIYEMTDFYCEVHTIDNHLHWSLLTLGVF